MTNTKFIYCKHQAQNWWFIHFHTSFFNGEGCGGRSPQTQNTSQFIATSGSSACSKTKMELSQFRDVTMPPSPWLISELLFYGCKQQDLLQQFFLWLNQCCWDLSLEIHSCILCHKHHTMKFLQNFHHCCLHVRQNSFSYYLRSMTLSKDQSKDLFENW